MEDYSEGYLVCTACGLVASDEMVIDARAPWSDLNQTSARPTAGACAKTNRTALPRLYTRDKRKPKSLLAFEQGLRDAEGALSLSEGMCATARELFVSLTGSKVLRGRLTKGAVAVSVYCACKREGYTRSVEEVCQAIGAQRDAFVRARQRMWDVDLLAASQAYEARVSDILSMVTRYLPLCVEEPARATAVRSRVNKLVRENLYSVDGRKYAVVAAAALFVGMSGLGMSTTKVEVARTFGVSVSALTAVERCFVNAQ